MQSSPDWAKIDAPELGMMRGTDPIAGLGYSLDGWAG